MNYLQTALANTQTTTTLRRKYRQKHKERKNYFNGAGREWKGVIFSPLDLFITYLPKGRKVNDASRSLILRFTAGNQ